MRIGVVYPQTELGGDPEAVRRIGQAAEELGFDHLLAYDHVLGAVQADRDPPLAGPYTERDPFHDPFVMFAYLAGRTERLGFVTGVLVLPQRQTAIVARQAADLSLLSDGRLRLGVGVGWNHVEYEALGQDFASRGARQEEQIDLLRRLWTEPVVEFAGRFDRVDRAALVPRPAESIPVWLGGFGPVAYDRAARIADGFIFSERAGEATGPIEQVRARLEEHGRSIDAFGLERVVGSADGPDEIIRQIEHWEQMGGTHVAVSTMRRGFYTADQHIEHLDEVARLLGR